MGRAAIFPTTGGGKLSFSFMTLLAQFEHVISVINMVVKENVLIFSRYVVNYKMIQKKNVLAMYLYVCVRVCVCVR